jgi:hypothetical protein
VYSILLPFLRKLAGLRARQRFESASCLWNQLPVDPTQPRARLAGSLLQALKQLEHLSRHSRRWFQA